MKSLKKIAAPVILAAAGLAVTMPAQARNDAWHLTSARNSEIRQDVNSLGNAIQRAEQRRTISKREANGLRNQARDVQRLYQRYARNGLDRAEVRNLQQRVNSVRVALRMERRDWDNRRG